MTRAAHDVIVVGGGVFGSAVTWELAQRGVDVVQIDQTLPGRATSASAGGLWPVGESIGLGCGVIYHAAATTPVTGETPSAPHSLPAEFREYLVASNALFPALSERLREVGGIDIEYEPDPGLLFVIYNDRERAVANQIVAGCAGLQGVDFLSPEELARLEPRLTRDLVGGVLLSGEYQVNPMLLAEGFQRAAVALGAKRLSGCRVTRLLRRGDRVEGVETAGGLILGHTVVNAAGAWAGELAAAIGLSLPVEPVRGQVVLTETLPEVLNCSLSTPQCYLLQKRHGEVLIGSTTERVGFDVSVTPEAIRSLSAGAARAVPLLAQTRVKRIWSGLRPGTPDELPILGPMQGLQGYLNAAGGFRTGIVASPLTGRLVAQCLVGEEPDLPLEPYLAARFAPQHPAATG